MRLVTASVCALLLCGRPPAGPPTRQICMLAGKPAPSNSRGGGGRVGSQAKKTGKKSSVVKPAQKKPKKTGSEMGRRDESYLYYDEVEIAVRSGAGGHGAVLTLPKKGEGAKLKRTADNDFELPPGGGHGGDVVLFVDPSVGDLLHLRDKPTLVATRGGDSLGLRDLPLAKERWRELADADSPDLPTSLSNVRLRDGPPLRVPVPPGTFVRTKSGKVLGDLVRPGEELCVASGGEGGPCVLNEAPQGGKSASKRRRTAEVDEFGFGDDEGDALALNKDELFEMTRGRSPNEARLSLVMRTVADVGFVGFPNAGKSTLLAALSRATPEIAPFPFTTMMPNLGAMMPEVKGGGPSSVGSAATGSATATGPSASAPGGGGGRNRPAPTILADLPGLVEGAHAGKGLGRIFLRHLRRVRIVLYILDTSCDSPSVAEQYEALRNELRLYNPQYLERPHVVALNKLDVPLAAGGEEALAEARKSATRAIAASAKLALNVTRAPAAIVPISGLAGKGMRILKQAIDDALTEARQAEEQDA